MVCVLVCLCHCVVSVRSVLVCTVSMCMVCTCASVCGVRQCVRRETRLLIPTLLDKEDSADVHHSYRHSTSEAEALLRRTGTTAAYGTRHPVRK